MRGGVAQKRATGVALEVLCLSLFHLLWSFLMLPDYLLYPDHVIPPVEFISALAEFADFFKAHMGVEVGTVVIEVFVLGLGAGDAGIEVLDSHKLKFFFERSVYLSAVTAFLRLMIKIHRQLT